MLALSSPTSGGRSVGIVRSQTKATAFSFFLSVLVYVPRPALGSGGRRLSLALPVEQNIEGSLPEDGGRV
jgi:hypothetical protein